MQQRRMHKSSPDGRNVHQAWSKAQTMTWDMGQRSSYAAASQGCTNQSRRCENSTQTMQQWWMHKSCHQRSSMHLAWGSIDKETSISEGCRNLVNEEDYSGDTANTASITKNLQLSHCVLDLNLIRLRRWLVRISALQMLQLTKAVYLKRLLSV